MDSRVILVVATIVALVALGLTAYTLREPMTAAPSGGVQDSLSAALTGVSKQNLDLTLVNIVVSEYAKAIDAKTKSGGAKPLCEPIIATASAQVDATIATKFKNIPEAKAKALQAAAAMKQTLNEYIKKSHCTVTDNPAIVNVASLKSQIAKVASDTKV